MGKGQVWEGYRIQGLLKLLKSLLVDGASGYTTGAGGYTKKSNIVSVPVPLRGLGKPGR